MQTSDRRGNQHQNASGPRPALATKRIPLLRAAWLDVRDSLYLVLFVFAPCVAIAAQLTLSSTPLFLTTAAKPNIVFLTDDSGSMDWAMVTSENDGLITISPCNREFRYTHHDSGASGNAPATNADGETRIIPTELALIASNYSPSLGGVWRARNADYNKLYYNPNVRYSPWEGVDSTGAAYSNMPYTAARYDPYYPSNGTTNLANTVSFTTRYCEISGGTVLSSQVNFTVSDMYPAHYYRWGGSGSAVGANDSHELYEIRTSGCSSGATCPSTFARTSDRTDCTVSGGTATCTVAQELQNFANWFSYYRKRNLAAKNAISKVVASSLDRVAHATLHNNGGASNISILQMNQSATSGNKKTLLDGVFKNRPGNGTPLRTKLEEVGNYFECTTTNIFGLTAGSSNCPIQSAASGGECQQNFAVLMTDGFWNDTFTLVSNTASNADGDGNTVYDTLAGRDTQGSTLADVAMYYYERDLAASLSNRVPVIAGVDEATHQHMVTYGVAFGVTGSLTAGPTSRTQSFTWPTVSANASTTVDDLRHAAYNSRGEFLSAQSPEALATALNNTLVGIAGRTGSAAAVAVNSRSLSTTTRLYQARFISGEWSGDLRALSISSEGNVDTQVWSAAAQLKSQNWDTGRTILTANTISHGIPFRWTTSGGNALTAAQQSYLHTDPDLGVNDSQGSARLDYLRGSTTHEGTGNNYRVRADSFKLGDIVNSTPVFVGSPPNLPALETDPHSDFRTTYVSRREIIYVGANDGMLHGFDGSTGQEKISFVPTAVFPNLSKLTYLAYSHNYFVDGAPTVGDAYGAFRNINSSCGTECWRTVLVGAMGAGGKGVFALDVTDPDGDNISGLSFSETNAANIVLWEMQATGENISDLGYVYGQPTIAKVRTGANSYAYAAIFGNGYNSTSERPILYIVNVVDGSIIKKVVLNSTTGTGNGLGSPAVIDTDGDYVADLVYAGDINGSLWKIDITATNLNSWKSPLTSQAALFVATDASSAVQRITQRPEVSSHPAGQSGYMVYFGTGRYFVAGDNSASASPVNTFYGIWDRNENNQDTVPRDTLLQQVFSTATVASTTVRSVTNTTITWCDNNNVSTCTCPSNGSGECMGWRDDLLTTASDSLGEMSVSNPVLLGGTVPRIIFTTLIPQSDPCSYGGTSWLMELNPTNGGRLSEQVFDINGDGTITSADKIGGTTPVAGISPGIGIMPEPVILRDPANRQDLKTETGSSGAVQTIKNYVSGTTGGRQSWRQLK